MDELITKFNRIKSQVQAKEKELIQAQTKLETYNSELENYSLKLKELGFSSPEDAQTYLSNLEEQIAKDLQQLELNLSNPSTLNQPQATINQDPIPTSDIPVPSQPISQPEISDDLASFM